MNQTFTESAYENALTELFTEQLGYAYTPGFDIPRDPADVVLGDILREKIAVVTLAGEVAVRKVLSLDSSPGSRTNGRYRYTRVT